jgi:sugar lactone lactonase YvrE
MDAHCRTLAPARDQVGECPVWSVAEQALYWVDIEGRRMHRWSWATQQQRSWSVPERVGCIALTAQPGALLAAMETGIFAVSLGAAPDAAVRLLAPITHPMPNMRFNDGRCDRAGRFWVTTMCMDMALAAPVGGLFCFDGRTLSTAHVDGLVTPNGMAFSPDGRTAYLSDSHPSVQKIWAFDFDGEAGRWSRRREFVDMQPLPGRPDGAAVDAAGHYWICGNDAGLVHRFSPGGQLVQSLPVPVPKPAMCAFGGPDLDVLLVTSIRPATAAPEVLALSGAVFALTPGVKGLPEPVFSGPVP